MGFLDRLFGWHGDSLPTQSPQAVNLPGFPVQAYVVQDFNDPEWSNVISGNAAGAHVTTENALKNSAVQRCVSLIANSMGMLPLHLMKSGDGGSRKKASSHPLFNVLHLRPNAYQSAFTFRRLMQKRVLTEGNAYALVVRTGSRVVSLNPIHPRRVTVEQDDDWTIRYRVRQDGREDRFLQPHEMLHIMGDSDDGLTGVPLAKRANEVLGLTRRAEEAAARVFKNGVLVGGVLYTDQKLGSEAIANLKQSLDERYTGAENAHRSMVLEQGLKYQAMGSTSRDAQNLETRAFQIEEIARIFGVPRPFLMVDDTSWGSGIEQLGIFFVQYGLSPWFKAWEEAISITLLSETERRDHYPKFNERALLRGSMADQATFLSKMMGAGGSPQIMEQNEARGLLDLPEHPDGSGLSRGATGAADGTTRQD